MSADFAPVKSGYNISMDIHFDPETLQRLENLARRQNLDIEEVIQQAVEQYLAGSTSSEDFEAHIERVMHEHQWLLDELAKG